MDNLLTALVAGHRPDRLPSGIAGDHLFADLENVLSLLRNVAANERSALRVLTGMAKGTDEATARVVENLELPLHLLAPGRPEPLTVSQQRAERVVWLGAQDQSMHGDEAFAVRDELALSFADLLVVVWNGESPQGLSGGTVRLAFQAALMMKPVVWLATDGKVRMLDRTRLNAPYLHKLRCPHPEPSWLCDCFSAPLDETSLREVVAKEVHLVLDPSPAATGHDVKGLADYQAAVVPRIDPIRAGHVHEAIMALLHFDLARMSKQFLSKVPRPDWGQAKPGENHPIEPMPLIDARFEHFDVEAKVAAGHHRDSTWLIYGASAMAVFSAVAGAIGLWPGGHNAIWPVVELLLIGMIIGGFALAKRQRWHGKWIGYRFIAEQLRYARMCLSLLGVPRLFMTPVWQVQGGMLQLASPELWFVQRTLITEGLPRNAEGTSYVASAEAGKARIAEYIRAVVEVQMSYHHRNHHKLHTVHARLHKLEIALFGATVIAVLAHFVIHASWLLICTAVFPALAAAVYGLTSKLEMTRIEGQSAATERELMDIAVAIEEAEHQPGWEGWFRLRQLSLDAAMIMSDENGQWQLLIRHQGAGLP